MPIKNPEANKAYMREYVLKRYHQRRATAITDLGGACKSCGKKEDLQFDHIDPDTKVASIADLLASSNEETLQFELKKCQLLCVLCHKEKSSIEGSFCKGEQHKPNLVHGTKNMYKRHGCRCLACVDASGVKNTNAHQKEIIHGTRAGYQKERRTGLAVCGECRAANAEYSRQLWQRRRKFKGV